MTRRAFTLIELLVVLVIILAVSVLVLPSIIGGIQHRQVGEAARELQAALAGARDAAIRDNAPSGIRLLPDPAFTGINPATGRIDAALPLAYNRIIPITTAPSYSDGLLVQWPAGPLPPSVAALLYPGPGTTAIPIPTYGDTTALMVYELAFDPVTNIPNPPTSWFWNIRIGDKLQIGNAGKWYTIIGPMVVQNPEMFVNVGRPGTVSPLLDANRKPLDFLLLVNGLDDNHDGWIDSGWDGVDNNPNFAIGIDDISEWIEIEVW